MTLALAPSVGDAVIAVPELGAVAAGLRTPGRGLPILPDAAHRDVCTDCGVSRSEDVSRCGRACQFIHPRYDVLERVVHGRERDATQPDELYFGVHLRMHRAQLATPLPGAQWSGITTALCETLLRDGAVDAVVAMTSADDDKWQPVPALITDPDDLARCRGMKMGYAPIFAVVEQAVALGYRRLAVVGVACQVHAIRALEHEMGLERLYVIGTPCSDNTTTEHFHQFLSLLSDDPDAITYLEFMPDMHVELRFRDGSVKRIPFLALPLSQLPRDFFPLPCRSCFDYTNALSDITVGYMAGRGAQWLIVRNARGEELMERMGSRLVTAPLTSSGDRRGPVRGFIQQVARANGGLPLRRTPRLLRPLVGWMMSRFGPKGLEFARARVEMRHAEGILTLRRERPQRMRRMIPKFAWTVVAPYDIAPAARESAPPRPASSSLE